MLSSWKNSALEPVRRILASLTGAVYPGLCPLCQTPLEKADARFCAPCEASLIPLGPPRCPKCGEPFAAPDTGDHLCGNCSRRKPPFAHARAFGLYQGALAEGIKRLKFSNHFTLVRRLAVLLEQAFIAEMSGAAYDLIIPVPLHRKRLRQRGFNQAILIALPLARHHHLRLDHHNLVRVRDTPPQYGLSRHQREQNVKGAFSLQAPKAIAGRRVLLVDDILTTGATARECARTLRRAKAANIDVLTLARAGMAQAPTGPEESDPGAGKEEA
jgi:ComF family protein